MRTYRALALPWVFGFFFRWGVCATEPVSDPILRLDPTMHTAVVRALAMDGSCGILASASEDKTIKVWSIPSGRLLQNSAPADRTR